MAVTGGYGLRVRLSAVALWAATTALGLALATVTGVVWILLTLAQCVGWLTARISDLIAEVDQAGGEGEPNRQAGMRPTAPANATNAAGMVVEGEVISVCEEKVVSNV